MLGAKVYEKPTFKSKIMTELKVGESIRIESVVQTDEQMEIGTGFSLNGDWMKPIDIDGFVFSSDLSDKNVKIGKNRYGEPFINLLGKLTNREEKRTDTNRRRRVPEIFRIQIL